MWQALRSLHRHCVVLVDAAHRCGGCHTVWQLEVADAHVRQWQLLQMCLDVFEQMLIVCRMLRLLLLIKAAIWELRVSLLIGGQVWLTALE